ncbi:MAG: hypothetical protein GEU93_16975 [Propionibacteriales bacterium]|nr:hypothetical protein [Propionibacteriales bacterium]
MSATALAALTLVPSASFAEPSIDEVEARVERLYHESEQAQERLNDIKYQMAGKRERLQAFRTDLAKQRRNFRAVSETVAGMVASQAQSADASLTATQQLIFAPDDDAFLDKVAATQALNGHQGELLAELENEAKKLELRREQLSAELAGLAADREQIAEEQKTVDENLADAEELLSELEAEQRAALDIGHGGDSASRTAPRAPVSTAVSGNAAVAVQTALDQVGDAYVYGAAGPDAFDCSGLTMYAWAAAGVSLPHSSSAQYGSGTPVSSSELQLGDLVFYYDPISHVGMYIGNGQIVDAANPETGVRVTGVFSMPYSGAVRVG